MKTKNYSKFAFTILFLLFSIVSAFATNYYVDAINGNNSNSGRTEALAKRSIQAAANLTNPGDTVFIMNGIYNPTNDSNSGSQSILTVSRSGTAGNYITYKNYPGHTPKLQLLTGLSYQVWRAIAVDASYIIIDGLEIEGTNQFLNYADAYQTWQDYENNIKDWAKISMYNCGSISLGDKADVHHIEVRNCKIHDTGGGIGGFRCDYVTIENNNVYNTCWYSMYAGSGISILDPKSIDQVTTYKMFIRNNVVHNNKTLIPWERINALSDGNGIILDVNIGNGTTTFPYVGRYLVENNVSYNNGGGGVHAYKCAHVDIINNTAYNNGTVVGYPEIDANNCSDVKIYNNIMYARTGGNANGNDTGAVYDYNLYFNSNASPFKQGPNDLIGNPQFTTLATDATANFRLNSNSPAINNGSNLTGQFSAVDILGVARPVGFLPDMGAYEHPTVIPRAEINIKQAANDIVDNTGTYNFGDVSTTAPKIVTFTIQNLGDQVLNLTGTPKVTVTGSGFSLQTDAPASVSAASTATFQVVLTPTAVGSYSGTVSVANDDANENPYNFAISGYGYDGNKALQTLTFNALPVKVIGAADFDPAAVSSASLAVTYTSSNAAVATIVNGKIRIVNAGTSTITASQAGDGATNPAKSISQELTVTPVLPTPGTNLITNSTFDTNLSGWSPANKNGGTATVESVIKPGFSGNAIKITTTAIGTNTGIDNVQYGIRIFLVKDKNYLIQFKASADAVRDIGVSLFREVSPFSTVFSKTTALTTTPTVYGTYAFTSNYTGYVSFRLLAGKTATPVYVDDVQIFEDVMVNTAQANLSVLSMSNGILSPAFAANTTMYTASVGNTVASITVTPTLEDPNATVKVNGTTVVSGQASASIALNTGANTITVAVTAQDGTTTKTYTITVNRAAAASSNANLSALSFSAGTLSTTFSAATTAYSGAVANSITTTTITPTVEDVNATVKVNGTTVVSGQASASIALNTGANTITVAVTAQDGTTTKTYTITVTRAAASTNANLSALTVSSGTLSPAFSAATTAYSTSVASAIATTTVTPSVEDPNATVKVNGTTVMSGQVSGSIVLNTGANTITVAVTAQDGTTTKTYTITVNRAAPASSNANLSALSFSAGTLSTTFSAATTSYSASVASAIATTTVTPSVEDPNASVKVNGITVVSGQATGSIALNTGANTITIAVTAQDGTTIKTYTITVTRAAATNSLCNDIPTGEMYQTFISGKTIADLVVTGTNVKWYISAAGGSALSSTTTLTNGTTYYATQTINSCESTDRLGVQVTINNPTLSATNTTLCFGQTANLSVANATIPTRTIAGYTGPFNYNNHSYYISSLFTNWPTAKAKAAEIGGYLVSPTTAPENNYVYSLLPDSNYWIGLSDSVQENTWLWESGEPFSFSNWYPGEPNNSGDQDYVNFDSTSNKWVDNGVTRINKFIVEFNSNNIPSYSWSTGETTASITPTPAQTTTYWVDVTLDGKTVRKEITITVKQTPTATTASATQSFCEAATVANLTATGTAIKWYATATGGTVLASTTALVNNTTYYASQTVDGCESQSRLAIKAEINLPDANLITSGSTVLRVNDFVVISTATSPTPLTYKWFKDGVLLTNSTSSSLKATTSGIYKVVITNTTGCISTSKDIPVYVLSQTNYSVSTTEETCVNAKNGKINVKTSLDLPYTASLSLNGAILQTKAFKGEINFETLSGGIYSLCITVDQQADYKECYEIKVNKPQELSVFSTLSNNNIVTISLSGASSYQVNLNGKITITKSNQLSLPVQSGINNLSVSSDMNCQGVYNENFVIYDQISAYPNPFIDELSIKLPENVVMDSTIKLSIKVYTLNGVIVYESETNQSENILKLNLGHLAKGVYLLHIDNAIYKIVKK